MKVDANKYKLALERMEELLHLLTSKKSLTSAQQQELDEVSDTVVEYEERHHAFQPETLIEMIELRMFQRQMKQKDLAKLLDTSPSRISEILNGKRDLTMDLARQLYRKLNVDADLILK